MYMEIFVYVYMICFQCILQKLNPDRKSWQNYTNVVKILQIDGAGPTSAGRVTHDSNGDS